MNVLHLLQLILIPIQLQQQLFVEQLGELRVAGMALQMDSGRGRVKSVAGVARWVRADDVQLRVRQLRVQQRGQRTSLLVRGARVHRQHQRSGHAQLLEHVQALRRLLPDGEHRGGGVSSRRARDASTQETTGAGVRRAVRLSLR